jgi:hypothetical protein
MFFGNFSFRKTSTQNAFSYENVKLVRELTEFPYKLKEVST